MVCIVHPGHSYYDKLPFVMIITLYDRHQDLLHSSCIIILLNPGVILHTLADMATLFLYEDAR